MIWDQVLFTGQILKLGSLDQISAGTFRGQSSSHRSNSETWALGQLFPEDHDGGLHFEVKGHPEVKF